jgi:mannitol/fructose-specific phosphotransferase system IIA component (Ntr-type)
MESTVNMFKHQIMSSLENEEMLEQLETAVNEAEALDAVLDERRRNRLRI